ncbi:MAG: 4-alpha-glucanotransferase [Clostridiales bacterium]|nr:4-alpha-glucanotransferase [Clostridiales bacterium]
MGFKRGAGVLCNISSLPGKFGIGCFSYSAESFARQIADMGFHWWQVLPLTSIGYGNSPYSGISTFAGNSLYINPFELKDLNLLTAEEADSAKYWGDPYKVNYAFAKNNVKNCLEIALTRLTDELKEEIEKFRKEEAYWIEDYALFMAIAEEEGKKWINWSEPLKNRDEKALINFKEKKADRIYFYVFEQFEFYREWYSLKKKINQSTVGVIGDLPFYVASNSVDVWANRSLFQLDGDGRQTAVAGVPPDAFSADGQIWGNPLYDFDEMKRDGYGWWRKRVKHCFKLYDALRLDHFRAFHTYFSIPNNNPLTAKDGEWVKGPGLELIEYFKKDNPEGLFIAEDLGLITEDVQEFVEKTGFPGIRVFQFGFDGTPSPHLPHNYDKNVVCYTGTHDNTTLLDWFYKQEESTRNFALQYCGFHGAGWGAGGSNCMSNKAVIKTLIMNPAILAVFPIQDLLGYGADTRMNIPGVPEGNWEFRVSSDALMTIDRNYFLELNNTYGRNRGSYNI